MKKSHISHWLLSAAIAALLPITAASGRGMGGSAGMGPHFSGVNGFHNGGFGHFHDFNRNDRFFRHGRFFVHNDRFSRFHRDRFFRFHRDRFFFGFNVAPFGYPYPYPYPYPYWYPWYAPYAYPY
jgi:hypothetical protein